MPEAETSDNGGVEQTERPGRVTDVTKIREMDHRDLTVRECLTDIGRIVGFRGYKRTVLHKLDLDSCFWYLTGEQFTYRNWYKTERSPTRVELLQAVADAAGFVYVDEKQYDADDPTEYRRNQLRALAHALRESDDNRR